MKSYMDHKKIKILAIDDNKDNLIILKALIEDIFPDALPLTASTGENGLELAAAEDPDVILLDIVMPVMDGFEICQKLKADKNLSDIPVVFVTALKGDQETRIRALEAGAEAFLAKPIDVIELIAQIRAMVKIKTANIVKRDEKKQLDSLIEKQTLELTKTQIATLNLLEDVMRENEARKKSEQFLKDSQEQLRIFAGHLNTIREEERVDIARELHDVLGQNLSAIKMDLCMMIRKLDDLKNIKTAAEIIQHASNLIPMIEMSINQVRKISAELRPHLLEELGLIPAIELYADEFGKRSGISCRVITQDKRINIQRNHAIGIFRIMQEALTNVMRHANAASVLIRILKNKEAVVMEIEDDGVGINAARINNFKSIGILGMRERSMLIGAELTIGPGKVKGTKVTITIPLKTSKQ